MLSSVSTLTSWSSLKYPLWGQELTYAREIFLRELISNANDALEKLRLTALTDRSIWDGSSPLNITIKSEKDEDGKSGRLIIAGNPWSITPFLFVD